MSREEDYPTQWISMDEPFSAKPKPSAPVENAHGNELYRKRVRVVYEFDVRVNDQAIQTSRNDQASKEQDLALLRSFLTADKKSLHEMLTYQVAIELGFQKIEEQLLGKRMERDYEQRLFKMAIDQLEGDAGDYWRAMRDIPPALGVGDVLGLCTEQIIRCFSVHYAKSYMEIVEEGKDHEQNR